MSPDTLHLSSLKELAMELDPIFGELLKEWSVANICPLMKKGERALVSNIDWSH